MSETSIASRRFLCSGIDSGEAPAFRISFLATLACARSFEFVNGSHDTANAVATVIYTNSLPAVVAVMWSDARNLLGVLVVSGAIVWNLATWAMWVSMLISGARLFISRHVF